MSHRSQQPLPFPCTGKVVRQFQGVKLGCRRQASDRHAALAIRTSHHPRLAWRGCCTVGKSHHPHFQRTGSHEATMSESASSHNDPLDDVATPSDREALENASAAVRNRLTTRGVRLLGDESVNELAQILDAVERFEVAVERHGGDLMVDEAADGRSYVAEPDDPRFVLPVRRDDESVRQYIQRIDSAAWEIQGDTT